MNCPTHNKPFRQGLYGMYCATKMPDGTWCTQKPSQFQVGKYNSPKYSTSPTKVSTNWDVIGAQKALCGMVNAQLSNGIPAGEINIPELYELLREIVKLTTQPGVSVKSRAPLAHEEEPEVEYLGE